MRTYISYGKIPLWRKTISTRQCLTWEFDHVILSGLFIYCNLLQTALRKSMLLNQIIRRYLACIMQVHHLTMFIGLIQSQAHSLNTVYVKQALFGNVIRFLNQWLASSLSMPSSTPHFFSNYCWTETSNCWKLPINNQCNGQQCRFKLTHVTLHVVIISPK